jgi:nicotinamide-nucleotide amidase
MHAEIVMIGTELLLGELVDTNANRLAKALRSIGLDLYYKTSVGDNEERITEVLNLALDRSDVVITSGGIGPTVDDVTRQAVANATGRKLVYSDELEAQIATRFRRFGREMAENNKRQAYIPDGALPLPNPVGTAPCFLSEDVKGRGCIISLPGVPRELEYMLENSVLPLLIERMGGIKVTKVHVLRTCAVGESNIDRAIGDLMMLKNPTVGLAAHVGQTDVRITAKADTEPEADALIEGVEAQLRERLGIAIYAVGKVTVPEVVGGLLDENHLNLGVIDMLTGGQLVRDLTEAGFGALITADHQPTNLAEALEAIGLSSPETDRQTLAAALAEKVAPAAGIGFAMLGPFENNATFVSIHGPGNKRLFKQSRNYHDTDYVRRWLVNQGLDWIRRTILGQMESPVDWN